VGREEGDSRHHLLPTRSVSAFINYTALVNNNYLVGFSAIDSLCAIIRIVLPWEALSKAACAALSDSESRAEVPPSSSRIFGLDIMLRVVAILCFCLLLGLYHRTSLFLVGEKTCLVSM
jgi:hypothetical protein